MSAMLNLPVFIATWLCSKAMLKIVESCILTFTKNRQNFGSSNHWLIISVEISKNLLIANTLAVIELHGSQCCLGSCSHSKTNTNSKKLSESNLRRCTNTSLVKLIQMMNENATYGDFAFYMGLPDLLFVTSSAENIYLARKRKVGPK